ncbi:MAG: Hsp70 family protein [Pseudomonadota bacterium]
MSTVIGIDLGTTNTVVSVVRDGQASALTDEDGQVLIPSVVSFHPNGSVLVGRAAKERRIVDSSCTIYSIKRLIGRSWESEEVRRARSRFPFEMREGPGQAALVVARGETYTLPEISAFVLRKAKSVAEAALGTTVDRAVITVPANFNDLQRAATKVAGRVAGLEVMRILNEPTAAALAYGYGRASAERVAVYDFGGGTFDVTLLDLSNNVFEVLATAGNTFLGGDDLDLAIAERMAELLVAQHRIDARTDTQIFERLRAAAEIVKHQLSTENDARATLPEIGHGVGGKSVNFEFSMTRGELERLAVPIVDRTFDVCREALSIARLTSDDFDHVLLVGGSTRIPLVRRRVEEFFKKPMRANINPDEVVAIGAAIQAAALSGAEKRKLTIPPAPNPAARTTQPNVSDAARQLGTLPPARPRFESSPAIPSTQPFFGRGHQATKPGLQPGQSARLPGASHESTLGALGKSPAHAPALGTLGGLASRQRVKTGPGLGPDASRAVGGPTLASASEEARSARESLADELGLPLVGAPQPASASAPLSPALTAQQIAEKFRTLPLPAAPAAAELARREESVALTLGDADFIEVEPPSHRPIRQGAGGSLPPPALDLAQEADLPLPEAPDEEITRVGATPSSAPRAATAFPSSAIGTPRIPQTSTQPYGSQAATAPVPPTLAPSAALPAPLGLGGFEPVPIGRSSPPVPLLIDVTPLTLAVETVHGFCDAIIERNTQVPCERERVFVTAADNQTLVRVRISQGESGRFGQNTFLGEIDLVGLRPAPRGEVMIAVSFSLDTSGMLNVSAKDVATARVTSAQLRLVTVPEAIDIAHMTQRNAARQI